MTLSCFRGTSPPMNTHTYSHTKRRKINPPFVHSCVQPPPNQPFLSSYARQSGLLHLILLGGVGGGGVRLYCYISPYSHKLLRKITVATCNHQVDSPVYLWPDICSHAWQAQKKSMVTHDTECPF